MIAMAKKISAIPQAQMLATLAFQTPIASPTPKQTNVLAPALLRIQRHVPVEQLLETFVQVQLHTAKPMALVCHASMIPTASLQALGESATPPPTPASSV